MPLRPPAAFCAALLSLASALFIATAAAGAADFVDAAGRRVGRPAQINRILPAERNAEVLVFVLAPEKLAGMSRVRGRVAHRPVLGWRPRSTRGSMAETAQRLHADLILDAGAVTPDRAAFA